MVFLVGLQHVALGAARRGMRRPVKGRIAMGRWAWRPRTGAPTSPSTLGELCTEIVDLGLKSPGLSLEPEEMADTGQIEPGPLLH